jgi:peptide/nickel transport system ATP-binding protein
VTSDPPPLAETAGQPAARCDAARLEVQDLAIRIGDQSGPDVVSEISFTVPAGEVLGLVGESGSGKTTVALALLGHARRGLSITSGQVRLDGLDLLRLRPGDLRELRGARVAYVPQDPSAALNPTRRVGTQLTEALRVHPGTTGDVGGRVREVLGEVNLDSSAAMLRRYPHQLSGGQQQRVALAMAFCCRPSLIVLDEPTTGLDVSTQRHVLDTVRSLCRSYGVAAVYVSHDLAVVGGLVAQVAVMYAGRIAEIGATNKVFPYPLHPYTRGLLSAVPSVDRAEVLAGIEGQPPRPGRRGRGCTFASRCGYVLDACRSQAPEPVLIDGRAVRCLRVADIRADVTVRRAAVVTRQAAGAPAPGLSLRALSAGYGGPAALSDIHLEVPAESCVAVVGESGSGKTTLARCIVGLHTSWTGDMTFQGSTLPRGVQRRSRDQLKQIQYVFQNPYTSLNPRKTVSQIVAQPLEQFSGLPFRARVEQATRVLQDVSLGPDFLSRYPDQLSGGERQRVAIARALVVEPELLVCDEVTSALDVSVQAVIVELLRRLQREHQLAMIFITHNLALVRGIAQSVIVLREGAVIESGPVGQVLERPRDPYTIQLLRDVPRLAVAGDRGGDEPCR